MENRPPNGKQDADQTVLPSAPAAEDEEAPANALVNLKMTQIKTTGGKDETQSAQNEWTVVYSDSNSSVLSGADDDEEEEQNIDISVVDGGLEKNEDIEDDDDEESDEETDDDEEDIDTDLEDENNEKNSVFETDANANINSLTSFGDDESKFQIWEQSVDSITGNWVKPILVCTLEGTLDGTEMQPSPSPSFADNEYESSDIDIINDDELEADTLNDDRDSILSMSISSVISQTSNLSMLREQYLQAHLSNQNSLRRRIAYKFFANKDIGSSVASDDENIVKQPYDPVPLSKVSRIRAYVHTPNTGLNSKLNLILILSVTAVVGLGIGHFIGWSNQWRQQKQLSMGQVIKLKQLQDDLLVCMKYQDMAIDLNDDTGFVTDNYKVCHRDSDYWKQRFETLFSENKGLIELFQKTQKHFRENGDHQVVIGEHESTNKTTSEEFHNLKLDLLVNQMEHLKVLEVLEEVKSKGEQSQQRVKVLEEENLDLKKKLEEEEVDDQELEQTWGSRVAKLQTENEELRQTLVEDDAEDNKVLGALRDRVDLVSRENSELKSIIEQLEKQMVGGGSGGQPKWSADFTKSTAAGYVARYNIMRDRINEMMSENEELKEKIARYRWTSRDNEKRRSDDDDDDDDDKEERRKMNILKAKINVLHSQLHSEQFESRRWKEKFESIIKKMQYREQRKGRPDDREFDETTDHKEKSQRKHAEEEPRKRRWASFKTKWSKKFESISLQSKKYMKNFVDKVKNRWDRLHKKYSREFTSGTSMHGDKLVKIGQYLENVIENVQNFSENLLNKGMHSELFTFLTNKMTDFTNRVEKNLNLKRKETNEKPSKGHQEEHFYYKTKFNEPKETPHADTEYDEKQMYEAWVEDEEDKIAKENIDSPPPPPYPSISRKAKRSPKGDKVRKDWVAERAKY